MLLCSYCFFILKTFTHFGAFWNTGALPKVTTLNIPRWWHIFRKSRYFCVGGIDITCFFHRRLSILSLFRSLAVDLFPMIMIRLELRTCWILDRNLNVLPIQIFPSWKLMLLNSCLITSAIHVCATFCSVVFSGIFKLQAN